MSAAELTTRRGEALLKALAEDPAVRPWDVYPRPRLVREGWINLNGLWDYAVTEFDEPDRYDRQILVPFPVESPLSGIGQHAPEGAWHWYRTRFRLPEIPEDRVLLFHCGGIEQLAMVRFNGSWIGSRFPMMDGEFTEVLPGPRAGENELVVAVLDDLTDLSHPRGKQRRDRGGMWYTPVSGIWQTVWLEWVPGDRITELRVTPAPDRVTVEVRTVGQPREGRICFEGQTYPLRDGRAVLRPERPRLWSPEDPHLYEFSVEYGADRVRSYFALRTVSVGVVDGIPRLLLNGKPYFFNGLLDQGWWPDGLWTPADPACFADDLTAAKRLGFNMVRKHIKVEPELFYYECDRLGIAVFQDMVNNGSYRFLRDTVLPTIGFQRLPNLFRRPHPLRAFTFARHMEVTARRLYSHPSVVCWTIFNEGWGQTRGTAMYEALRALDPTRIIDTTSGWFRVCKTDVESRHVYFRKFRLPRSKRPVVLSEFGGYVWKVPGHSFNPDKTYGYKLFDRQADWQAAVQRLYDQQIRPAAARGLCADGYTQLSDVEDETNGMLSYDRRVLKWRVESGTLTVPPIRDMIG